ncbi:hypothetical protein SDRG_16583 [Saprolegnia diclina VS20]|uniref:Uncharacterized protein n=1 Tax=Saprolegnia diclina (strain VS20) TaxID=1156394 RepID=T0PX21_SAPDV|nr:hypothetical protein SDRG_16583 [Saprolegnia diclina VS20]EQC25565.1 hypothetical protein SDRG_16583 [Saprolegnia diclina VS20]|eukprot:XP_008621021.1 hypothetical protein SDRG_16583 [Saprolegnia diclina VS20]
MWPPALQDHDGSHGERGIAQPLQVVLIPSMNACSSEDGSGACSRTQWTACGLDFLHFALPLTAWGLFLSLTVAFVLYTRMWEEFRLQIDDLHDIPAQALGIVAARQKHIVLGRKIKDPRRLLTLAAMWAELPGFSYLPLQLLHYDFTGTLAFPTSSATEVYRAALLTGLFLFLMLTTCVRLRCVLVLRAKVLLPCLYDALYLVYMYAILGILSCAEPLDGFVVAGATCACGDRVWPTAGAGALVFSLFYLTALVYKVQLTDEVFATQFRYQTSFSSLMTMTRTACCLQYMTATLLLSRDSGVHKTSINLIFGCVNGFIMACLLRYNYRYQPCLGSGRFPNSLRSLSFSTSCYVSYVLVLVELIAPSNGTKTVVVGIACACYPLIAVILWRVNSKRANYFHIPSLPLVELLSHSNYRVRTVAVVSVVLEDHTKWRAQQLLHIVTLLQQCLLVPAGVEGGLLVAYTCQALWHLDNVHCLPHQSLEDSPPFVPKGLWLGRDPVERRRSSIYDPNRSHDIVERNATRSSATMTTSSVVPRLSSALTIQCIATRLDETALVPILQHALGKAISIFDAPFVKARAVVAKMLQEMYVNGAVRLSLPTYLHVLCTLCVHHRQDVVAAAAASLGHIVTVVPRREWGPIICDRHKLAPLAALLVHHAGVAPALLSDTIIGRILTHAMDRILNNITERDPATYWSNQFITHMTMAWRHWEHSYTLSIALEDVLLKMHRASVTYHATLRRPEPSPLPRVRSVGTGLSAGDIKTVSPSQTRHSTLTKAHQKRSFPGLMVATAKRSFGSLQLRHRGAKGKLSLQRMAQAFRHGSVVPQAILKEIALRRDLRKELMTHLKLVLTEGLSAQQLPQVFSPLARSALTEAVCLLHTHRRLRDHIEHALSSAEMRYVRFLESWETMRQKALPFFTDASLRASKHRVAPEIAAILIAKRSRFAGPRIPDAT